MTINQYISEQEPERQQLLTSIHEAILKTHKKISAEVGKMMGSDMIQYKVNNYFIYGLASQKKHMTLHAMPLYGCKPIHEKYSKLFTKAKFQKGCINFKNADEMPLDITEQLLTECAKIDMAALMEQFKKK